MADSIQQRIDKLDEAISSGVKSVFSDGERIEFQSIADMIAARNDLVRQASASSGRSPWRSYNVRPTMRW